MSEHVPKVEVQWLGKTLTFGDEDLLIKFSHRALPNIVIHKSGLSPEDRAGSARELLAAVASECIVEWMVILLKKARIEVRQLSTVAEVKMGNDEAGQTIADSISIGVNLEVPEDQTTRAENLVDDLLSKGCLMSRSLERGINLSYRYKYSNDKKT